MDMQFEVNKLHRDEFGRVNGIIAVNKLPGLTSHDVVDRARKILKTRKVGHAGALDPFATGLLLLLVGKATKLSNRYTNSDKEYIGRILFGISTDSADTEGRILEVEKIKKIENLENILQSFSPEYEQYVSVFSSVKVNGEKLRVLARKFENFKIIEKENDKWVRFFNDTNDHERQIVLPKQVCKIPDIELLDQQEIDISSSDFFETNKNKLKDISTFPSAKIRVACSKGTYIRALAEDIGNTLNPPVPAMLWELARTKVGDFSIKNAVSIEQLVEL